MDLDAVALIERRWPNSTGTTAIPAAFEQLFRAEYARVVRVAYRVVGDQAEAEDVAQDVFVSFYRAHPADAPYAAAWLHRASAHLALNAIRLRSRRAAREERDASGRDAVADPVGAALERERAREVRATLARMPRGAAELLALRYSGLSYAEVAAATGTKIDQVGTRLRRAHDAFRKEASRGQHR
jgi:RNA polymerase sigma-70 factor (ECF subfamily)